MPRSGERLLIAEIKPELFVFETDEINAETPLRFLDDDITPAGRIRMRRQWRRSISLIRRRSRRSGKAGSTNLFWLPVYAGVRGKRIELKPNQRRSTQPGVRQR